MATNDPHPTVRLHGPGDLIAALPALLGFYPEDSLVAVHTRCDRIVLLARYDLARLVTAEQLDGVAAPTGYVPTEAAYLVIVADTPTQAHTATVAAARDRFRQAAVQVLHALWTPAIRAGAPWQCYDQHPGCHGQVPDPRSSTITATATYHGQVIHPSRRALADQLTPDDPAVLARRAALIAAHANHRPQARIDGARAVRDALQAATLGVLPTGDEQIAELAVALNDPRTRDACLAHATGPHAPAAEQLWIALVRATPPPHRAGPAILLAITAYLRGNTILAVLALHAAVQAHPGDTLAALLQLAIATGLPPDELRHVITQATPAVPHTPTRQVAE